jgi:hypothetical protein
MRSKELKKQFEQYSKTFHMVQFSCFFSLGNQFQGKIETQQQGHYIVTSNF